MKPATLVSVDEYLSTSYRPDCDFLEGVVLERNTGEYDHARVQAKFVAIFDRNEQQWKVRTVVEQRVQVTRERFRIPDVCLLRGDAPVEQIIRHALLLCVEVLSKDDRMSAMQDRIDDYFAMGVACVWTVDPQSRKGRIHTSDRSWEPKDGILRVEATDIAVPLADLFAGLT